MIPAVGQKVGPYEILGRLGTGGMGIVFSAWDSRLQREVAIKLLRDEFLMPDMRERFLHEARAASGLNHPNICTIFDIGEQDGDPYMVMELLRGETLRSHIAAGAMPAEEIVHTGMEVAEALAAAHARGIIHRDVKPANIFLVTKPGAIWHTKVLDFGLAKMNAVDALEGKNSVGPRTTVGTVSYMSPEQARGEPLDARSDLFSLGIVLHEMATGHVPFQGATSALVFVQLLSHPAEPVRELNAAIPKDLERIIFKLLKKDRAERFQSAEAVREALRGVVVKKAAVQKPGILGAWGRAGTVTQALAKAHDQGEEFGAASGMSRAADAVEEDSVLRPVRRVPSDSTASRAAAVEPTVAPQNSLSAPSGDRAPGNAVGWSEADFAQNDDEEGPKFAGEDEAAATQGRGFLHSHWALVCGIAILSVIAYGVVHWMGARVMPTATRLPSIMLAGITNRTDQPRLSMAVSQALRFDLAESARLAIPSVDEGEVAARTGGLDVHQMTEQQAQVLASAMGATSFLQGEVRRDGDRITVKVEVVDTATGKRIQQVEQAATVVSFGKAIDRIAHDIRIGVGEPGDAVTRSSTPLEEDATSSLQALIDYAQGDAADYAGKPVDAVHALQHAVAVDPRFTQGWLRLADLYRREGAEASAAEASTQALNGAERASGRVRTLAQAAHLVDRVGDYAGALRLLDELSARYPRDLEVASMHAMVLRLAGKLEEAVDVAQGVLARSATDFHASGQAEMAMLALERPEAAAHLESKVARTGQQHPGAQILIAFLNARPGSALPELAKAPVRYRAQAYRAEVLDATGQWNAGMAAWGALAAGTNGVPALRSAGASALADAALDRAVGGRCGEAVPLARSSQGLPQGAHAMFASAMAQGLCGDVADLHRMMDAVQAKYPGASYAQIVDLPQMRAVEQIRSKNVAGALETLQAIKPYDAISLAPYLRALAHAAGKQWEPAIADYQFILQHRGATTLACAPAYPMAQLGLARAYAAMGDKGNSAAAYASFAQMWSAPGGDPLLQEAKKQSP